MKALLQQEQKRYYHINLAIKLLGGIPSLLRNVGSGQIPSESTMVVFLGYLFNRLTETTDQVHSVRLLQRTYRNYRMYKQARMRLQELQAIEKQKKNEKSVVYLQRVIRGVIARSKYFSIRQQHRSSISIQSIVRMVLVRKRYHNELAAKKALQSQLLLIRNISHWLMWRQSMTKLHNFLSGLHRFVVSNI